MNQPQPFGRREKLALIGRLVNSRMVRNDADFASCFTADAVFWLMGSPVYMPYAGRRVGRAGLIEAIRYFDAELRQYDAVFDPPMIDGDQAALRWRMTIQPRGCGDPAPAKCFLHLKFENWLIKEFIFFVDTAMVIKLTRGE